MIKIKIIRHSERLDFAYPLYWMTCRGEFWCDSPLTDKGHKTAKLKGELLVHHINPEHIYTSPYIRTITTAIEIAKSYPEAKVIEEPLLSEYQSLFKHCPKRYPHGIPTSYNDKPTEFSYPETYEKFCKRADFILEQLISRAKRDFLIVTHGAFLTYYIQWLKKLFPKISLPDKSIGYLTTLSFSYNLETSDIVPESITLE